jgi:hypothetical protein
VGTTCSADRRPWPSQWRGILTAFIMLRFDDHIQDQAGKQLYELRNSEIFIGCGDKLFWSIIGPTFPFRISERIFHCVPMQDPSVVDSFEYLANIATLKQQGTPVDVVPVLCGQGVGEIGSINPAFDTVNRN